MRKRIMPGQHQMPVPEPDWRDVEGLADVEITSEDSDYPIESALSTGRGPGWRAAYPGTQAIRLLFAHPQRLQLIRLSFVEPHIERTQEYVLRWSGDGGQSFQEIVRQQWNFSPDGTTNETEDHHINLSNVTTLELTIVPDISGGKAIASLAKLRIA